jgi:hypothetical protein
MPDTTTSRWNGRTCIMCAGTGIYYASANRPIPGTPFTDGTRDLATSLPCPACNGHGREPSDEEQE